MENEPQEKQSAPERYKTVKITERMHRDLRIVAIQENCNIQDVIDKALIMFLNKYRNQEVKISGPYEYNPPKNG